MDKPTDMKESPPIAHNGLPSVTASQLPCVAAPDLFGKHREILIEHAGFHYRLRITRANKLILTK